ncbi:hypothetical protein FRC08_002028, partial [Ceratobasidium sp. 394]
MHIPSSPAMRISLLATILGSLALQSAVGESKPIRETNILIGNDDGWAEANVRAFYLTLKAGEYNVHPPLDVKRFNLPSYDFQVVLSAPVRDQSGTGSSNAPAYNLTSPGQYDTVPIGAPAQGADKTDPMVNYVNSYPVTAIEYGIKELSPMFFHGKPDLIVSGPNVGYNLDSSVKISGTVGVATDAVYHGFPAIAFSAGLFDTPRPYTVLQPGDKSFVYAQVAQRLVTALTSAPEPWLPTGVGLNVNIPSVSDTCKQASDFNFILTRLYWASDSNDVVTCNNGGRLNNEASAIGKSKCYVTVSVFDGSNKGDANKEQQAAVLASLSSLL